jgi:predicted nucleic acid-binding protein
VSAISRRERDGDITRRGAQDAIAKLDRFRESWEEIAPHDAVRRTARRLLRVHALRSADALQLGAAIVAAEDYPETLELVSSDDRLVEAARREGFPVLVPSA